MPFAGATDYEKTYSKEACEGVYGKLQNGVFVTQLGPIRWFFRFTLPPTIQNRKRACVRKSDLP